MNKNEKIKSYKDLINFCKKIHKLQNEKSFNVKINQNKMVIYEDDSFTDISKLKNPILTYTFEDPIYYEFFKTLLNKKSNSFHTRVFCNEMNHYQFMMNASILDLLLTAKSLELRNIPINHEFKLKTKNKIRDITAPNEEIKTILKDINRILQYTYDKRNEDFQVAYKIGHSIKNNAIPHLNNKYIFKIDLHDFFPSCKKEYVMKYVNFLFKNSINQKFLKEEFAKIILKDDALFIGSPISGTLANVIISKPVEYMKRICDKFDISFSVYADDMTFGSSKFIAKDFIIDMFNRAFTRYDMENDFSLNEKKCYGVSNNRRAITGVVINHKDQLTCHRYMYNNIRQTLHQLSYDDTSHYNHNKLSGNIAFMSMLDESGKLVKLLKQYKTTVQKYKLVSDEKLESMGV